MTDKTDPRVEVVARVLAKATHKYHEQYWEAFGFEARAILTALDAYHAANGLVVVPREATEAMERAGLAVDNATINHSEIYAAMIAADSPDNTPPAAEKE